MANDEGIEAVGLKAETAELGLQWQGESDAGNPYGRDLGSVHDIRADCFEASIGRSGPNGR
jgi:hypothetical protein